MYLGDFIKQKVYEILLLFLGLVFLVLESKYSLYNKHGFNIKLNLNSAPLLYTPTRIQN